MPVLYFTSVTHDCGNRVLRSGRQQTAVEDARNIAAAYADHIVRLSLIKVGKRLDEVTCGTIHLAEEVNLAAQKIESGTIGAPANLDQSYRQALVVY